MKGFANIFLHCYFVVHTNWSLPEVKEGGGGHSGSFQEYSYCLELAQDLSNERSMLFISGTL